MRLTPFFPAQSKGDANDIPLTLQEDDVLMLWSATDLDTGNPIWIADIYSDNAAASGVPGSTYASVWNGSRFYNSTDKKQYHKVGTPGAIDGTWTVDAD